MIFRLDQTVTSTVESSSAKLIPIIIEGETKNRRKSTRYNTNCSNFSCYSVHNILLCVSWEM